MTILSEQAIREQLSTVLKGAKVQQLSVAGQIVTLKIVFGYPILSERASLIAKIQNLLSSVWQDIQLTIDLQTRVVPHVVQKDLKPLSNIKNIIVVASGKGGVGKSTVSVNVALALSQQGAKVGLLDADIYGPSQPMMLNAKEKPKIFQDKRFQPIERYGLQTISIGNLIDEETPTIWRGPMVSGALQQLLNETNWKDLDYLIIDLPPGTGDIQLTLAQKIPVSGAIVVTTPQDISLIDAKKALKMFQKVEVPVLGVVENMSVHTCSACGHQEHIFGEGGGIEMALKAETPFLGQLPLDAQIREQADSGNPSVVANPESPEAQAFRKVAINAVQELATREKDYQSSISNIVIQD